MIGCDCDVCRSTDPRDKRLRASVLVEYRGLTILVDAGPDFRYQMLRANIRHIDAILLTHNHKDHTGGLDDVRSFNLLESKPVNIWCQQYVLDSLRNEYSYAFPAPGTTIYPGAPEIRVNLIGGGVGDEKGALPFKVHSNECEETLVWESGFGYRHLQPASTVRKEATVIPIQGWHHKEKKLPVLGYRFGDIAYLTDLNLIDDCEIEKLRGLSCVTVNSVKRTPHHSHFSLAEAEEFFGKVGAKESYLTHISHLLPTHSELEAELQAANPSWHAAYDGLTIGRI